MEQILIEIEVDSQNASANLLKIEKLLEQQKKRQDELRKSIKQARAEGKEASESELVELAKVEQSVKSLSSARNTYSKVLASESNTLKALRAEVSKLNLERESLDVSTVEGAKRFQELTKQLNEYNETIRTAGKEAGQFKDNIGNYADSVKEAINNTSIFGVKIGESGSLFSDLSAKIQGASKAFVSFGRALLANPLFLLGAVLAGIVGAFLATEKGMKKLEVALAPLTQAFNTLFSIVAKGGEAVFFVFEKLTDVLGALTTALGLSSANAKELVTQVQSIATIQRQLDEGTAKRKADAEAFRKLRDDEAKDIEDRIKDNENLGRVLAERRKSEVGGLKEILAIREKELKAIPENLRTEENLNKVTEARVALNEKLEELVTEETEQLTNQVGLTKELSEREVERIETKLRLDLASGKIREGSIEQLNLEIKAIEKSFDAQIKATKGKQAIELLALQRDADIAEKRKEFTEKQVEAFQDAVEKQKELRDKAFEQEVAGLELSLLKAQENSAEALKIFADLQRKKAEIEITQNELTGKQSELVRFQAEQEIVANATKAFEARLDLLKKEAEATEEFAQKEAEAQQAIYDLRTQSQIEFLSKEQQLNRDALSAGLEDLTLNSEQKLAILKALNAQQIELLKSENAKKQEILNEQFSREIEGLEVESEQFAEVVLRFDELKKQQVQSTEDSINAINADAYEKRKQIKQLEVESEKAKINSIVGLTGALASAVGEQTLVGKLAAQIQATINAFVSASNVLKTVTALGAPPPIPQIAAGATFLAGRFFADKIGAINATVSGVQNVATSFNPALQFAEGGVIPSGFELPSATAKGDNTLILAKAGEVVLNQKQQSVIGASTFARAGVPGFADGGVVQQSNFQNIQSSFAINDLARAIANIPAPQVSVIDINKVQKQVSVKDSVGTL